MRPRKLHLPQSLQTNQLFWTEFPPEQHAKVISLVSTANTYRQIAGADLPEAVTEGLRQTILKAVAIRSDTSSGFVLVTNLARYEAKTMELDEHSFMIFALPGNIAQLASGAIIQHGDWEGRTTPADPALVSAVGSAFVRTRVATLHPLATDPPHEARYCSGETTAKLA